MKATSRVKTPSLLSAAKAIRALFRRKSWARTLCMAETPDNRIDENPYATPKSQPYEPFCTPSWRTKFRNMLVAIPLLWFACVVVTGMYADNVRYARTIGSFAGLATIIGAGAIISLSCLVLSIRRWWWHLVFLPLWLFFLAELLILMIRVAAVLLP
jgi:hypothetical protein